jgi:hypothetical protein
MTRQIILNFLLACAIVFTVIGMGAVIGINKDYNLFFLVIGGACIGIYNAMIGSKTCDK